MAFNKYKGTKTEENLKLAFSKECEAAIKYQYFCSQAKKDGFEQIAQILSDAANNEKEHGKIWFKELKELSNTEKNLLSIIESEHEDWANNYKKFAKDARKDGFNKLADKFEAVSKIEKYHEQKFTQLKDLVKEKEVFKKNVEKVWICRNCGNIVVGKEAPKVCPVCDHEQGYYMIETEEF